VRVDGWLPLLDPEIQSRVIDLRPFHLESVGLSPDDAIEGARDLARNGIAILGGELWLSEPSGPVHTPEWRGWHLNRNEGEAWNLFVARAVAQCVTSIQRLRLEDPRCFVVLTPSGET
jgi:hypothetical protein